MSKHFSTSTADRAAGAIMGAFIGDALGLGTHWYYDLDELRARFGQWISDYTTPQPDHPYHQGMQAGDLSQTGLIMKLLLESVVEKDGYDEADFTTRLERDILANFDGNPLHGPGGFTNISMRQVWQARREGKPWGEVAGNADTSEAAERAVILAARFATEPRRVSRTAYDCIRLTQNDGLIQQDGVAFASTVAALIRGEPLDGEISDKLLELMEDGGIPIAGKTPAAALAPGEEPFDFGSPDALLLPGWLAQAAHDPGVRIEPAWKVSLVYGMSCAAAFVLPAAYYLAARFAGDFESAVLHALNGGGQNMSRACLTGALAGAQCGLSGIPERFVAGLQEGPALVALARQAADRAAAARA